MQIQMLTDTNRKLSFYDAPHFRSPLELESNHIMVNRLRAKDGKRPLKRSKFLDDLSSKHAQAMSAKCEIFLSAQTVDELQKIVQTSGPLGQNVHCGPSVQNIQELIEFDNRLSSSRINVISDEFTEFGMGTARGLDGQIYLCQLFR